MVAPKTSKGLAVCALLLLPICLGSQPVTAPVFLWGSAEHVQTVPGLEASHVSYQTIPVANVVDAVLKSVAGGASGSPDALVVMLGSQVEVESLPRAARNGPLEPLQAMLRKAASAIMMPYAQRRTDDGALYGRVVEELRGERGESLQLIELCAAAAAAGQQQLVGGADVSAAVADALKGAQPGKTTVLLMCSPAEGGLTAEVAQLEAAVQAVQAAGKQYVAMYTADAAVYSESSRRRALQATTFDDEPEDQTCDEKCWAQVRVLEAIILLFILLLAVSGGTWIMGAVDTPTRFEAPKKEHGPME